MRPARAVLVAAGAGYLGLQWLARRSGALPRERHEPLPGDELVPTAQVEVTRAATLPAPPTEVWPWLAQVGWGRGGWYTPRWVDRAFFPANRPSARTLLSGLPPLEPGALIPDGPPETQCAFVVVDVDPERLLLLQSTSHLPLGWRLRGLAGVHWSWVFVLRPSAGGRAARLVFRWRSHTSPFWVTAGVQLLVVPADWIMSRGMLRGLADRVVREGQRARSAATA